jgi:hypothetical protein
MKMPSVIRATVLAFAALTGVTLSSAARADEGFVQLTIYKAGWVIGSNIFRPSDVAGVYGAAGAGIAVGRGARAIVLTNQKGAVLELSGHQVGLMANADLSGLAITLR